MPAGPRAWGGQPGSSPRTSLLHPSLAQPWGDLSQPLPQMGPWTALGGKSQRGDLAQGPYWGCRGSGRHLSLCLPPGSHPAGLQESPSPRRNSRKLRIKGSEQLAFCEWRCLAFLRREVLWGEVEPPQGMRQWQPSLSAHGVRRGSMSLELWTLASGPSFWSLPSLP